MHAPALLALSLAALLAPVSGQGHLVLPAGFEHVAGNYNNTWPFSGVSGRYQQIHDAVDIQTLGQAFVFNSLNFRINGTRTIVARQWDVELNLGHTSVTAAATSTTFASNFSTTPTMVLPFKTINGAAGTGLTATGPNPIQWSLPFTTPFLYLPAQGNLIWEWRHRNATGTSSTPMDGATNPAATTPAVGVSSGTGCLATGRTNRATSQFVIAGGNMGSSLVDGAANAAALLWLGFQRTHFPIPGWCAPLYVQPIVSLGGTTDATGTWTAGSVPLSALTTPSYFEAYAQYAFLDVGLPTGLGLSDLGTVTGPHSGGRHVARMYSPFNSNPGMENVTTGTLRVGQGLIAIFGRL